MAPASYCQCVWKGPKRVHVCLLCPPLVIIESPYAGDVVANVTYAHEAMLDSIGRGESPYASHLVFPAVLNDLDPAERDKGIQLGFAWGRFADLVAVYQDLGQSSGMIRGIHRAREMGIPLVYRNIRA